MTSFAFNTLIVSRPCSRYVPLLTVFSGPSYSYRDEKHRLEVLLLVRDMQLDQRPLLLGYSA